MDIDRIARLVGVPAVQVLLDGVTRHRASALFHQHAQQRLYGWDEDVSSNALDVHVHALRKKLDPALIRTLRGVGYALDERVAAADPAEGNVPA